MILYNYLKASCISLRKIKLSFKSKNLIAVSVFIIILLLASGISVLFEMMRITLISPFDTEELKINLERIIVNSMQEFDGLTKSEIYVIRKKHVANSLFNKRNYEPSEVVFGQIIDNKPWYGNIKSCELPENYTLGPSARSIYINNPDLLIGLLSGYSYNHAPQFYDTDFCKGYLFDITPSIMADMKNKTIETTYYVSDAVAGNNPWGDKLYLQFSGLNARDFGYEYVYSDYSKNIIFKSKNNVSVDVYKFRDFIHLGNSCKVKGGCNNTSPFQSELEFSIREFPAVINFKLWKRKPNNSDKEPDIRYIMKLKEY